MQMTEQHLQILFNEQLDSVGDVEIFNAVYPHSMALRKVDPARYRQEFAQWQSDLIKNFLLFPHSDGTLHDEPEAP